MTLSASRARCSSPIPPIRDAVPVKCLSISSRSSPTASMIWAPQNDWIVEIPSSSSSSAGPCRSP